MHKNDKILYEELAFHKIQSFMLFVRLNDRFYDTGIFNEAILQENYIKKGTDFINELIDTIEYIIKTGSLIRVIVDRTQEYEKSKINLRIRSYRILIKCKYIFTEGTYYIEDIIINT